MLMPKQEKRPMDIRMIAAYTIGSIGGDEVELLV